MIIVVFLSSFIVLKCSAEGIHFHFLAIRCLMEYLYSLGYLLSFCPFACIRIIARYNSFIGFIMFV